MLQSREPRIVLNFIALLVLNLPLKQNCAKKEKKRKKFALRIEL